MQQGVAVQRTGISKTSRLSRARRREAVAGVLWASPWLLGFFIFTLGPILASLYLSFTEYTIASQPKWIGLANFARALSGQDTLFWPSLARTFHYALIMVPLGIGGALLIAIALNQRLRAMPVLRTCYFLPSLTPAVAAAMIWTWLYQPEFGAINGLLATIGVEGPKWLADPDTALTALIIVGLWGSVGGGTMIIFLAGLQSVPRELQEAAEIDGAGRWTRFRHVTVPMLSPTILFNLVVGIVGALQVFTIAIIATNGGPNYATWFFIVHLYQNGFQDFDMGYASALAWIFLVIVLALTLINVTLSKRWVYYEGDNP
ncbi:MAG TPA: sugar ABC transporter permease [Chloroflexota bacterium]|nr:sugar ABC transporter permease [Chloroflexota bacterium]